MSSHSLLLVISSVTAVAAVSSGSSGTEVAYKIFREKYRNGEAVDSTEHDARFKIFQARQAVVDAHNQRASRSWTAVVNQFTDYFDHELQAMMGYRRSSNWGAKTSAAGGSSFLDLGMSSNRSFLRGDARRAIADGNGDSISVSMDWRQHLKTASSFIRDQGPCGSCWAVAAVGALEMHAERHGNTPRPLSYAQLVNCVKNPQHCGGEGGCKGATGELAFGYVRDNGLAYDDEYRHDQREQGCFREPASSAVTTSAGFKTLEVNKYLPLLHTIAHVGPVVGSIAAGALHRYGGGVFDECQPDAIVNHAVVILGFGETKGDRTKYWLIRNSWGPRWGERGHFRLLRQENNADGTAPHCGVDNQPQEGVGCDGGPSEIEVCGMCGILSDSAVPLNVRVGASM